MIYLKIINANMKTKTKVIRVSFWVVLGIAILLSNLALNRAQPPAQDAKAISAIQTGTASEETEAQSEAGSTDGIMFVALVIVLIVVIPILLKRQEWSNGKRNKTAPPS